jgi:hypothetical protein
MTVPPSPNAQPWQPVAPPRPQRWQMITLLVIALAAIGLAIGSWFRPLPDTRAAAPSAPIYTDQQVASAKANVCGAFDKVQHAVDLAHSHVGSTDYTTQLAASAITNLALDAGSRYLLTKLAQEPATPTDLATAVRNEANAEEEALIGYLNGLAASDPQMQPAVNASNDATATVRRLCK